MTKMMLLTTMLALGCGVQGTLDAVDGADVADFIPHAGQRCTCTLRVQYGQLPPKGHDTPDTIETIEMKYDICSSSPEESDAFLDDWIENTCKPMVYANAGNRGGGCYGGTTPECICNPYSLCFH